jgi:DNA-binding CsgD family transcriptional regulator
MADQTRPPDPAAPSLVGRAREQSILRDALSAALVGRGSLVLLGGEAGIGKTALAEALLAEAVAQSAQVSVGRCYDLAETPPYGPWAEALARLPNAGERGVLPTPLGPGDSAGSQVALFARIRDALTEVTGNRTLVLLLEDLHWADPGSLDLLRFIGRQLGALPLLLLATYRDDESAQGQPLATSLPALVREARAVRLTLPRLTAEHARAVVRSRYRLSLADEDRLVAHLHTQTEGNPLYLGELLRSFDEEGLLRPAKGAAGWTLGDLTGARVPALLRHVIDMRVARLGEAAGRLLAVAAVIGQTVPLDLWAVVSGADDEALADAVGRAVAARVLSETADGQGVRFAHALVRDALYEAAPLPRRRALHRRAAEALLAMPAPDPDAVAGHFQRAGDPRAVEWLTEAGHRAHRSLARRTAAERYAAALALVDGGQGDPVLGGWLLLHLAHARHLADAPGGIALQEEALRRGLAAGDETLVASARVLLGFNHSALGDFRRGVAEMIAGASVLDRHPMLPHAGALQPVTEHSSTLAMRLAWTGRCEAAFERIRLHPERVPTPAEEFAQGEAHAALGRADASRQAWERARALARRTGNLWGQGLFAAFELHGTVLPYFADELDGRRRLAREAEQALRAARLDHGLESVRIGSLPLLAIEGEWEEAREIAAGICGSSRAYMPMAASLLGAIARAQGEPELAWSLVRRLLPAGPDEEPGGTWHHDALRMQRLAAALALDVGDLATARAWLEADDRWLAWNGAVRSRAEGQLTWAEYRRAKGNPVEAWAAAERALAEATEPRQPLALLAAHRLLGELATEVGQISDGRAHLDAALALADACAAPYERALALLALAELRLAEGGRDAAEGALTEAHATLTALQARPALARCDALIAHLHSTATSPGEGGDRARITLANPAGLTVREVEVLRLVAAGRSNREMAEVLCRSERTIERHLENIYRKIAARNRADATAFALRHHLA